MKKNKILLFSILGVATISLASVGFASWMSGITQKTQETQIGMEVDTSTNNSQVLEVKAAENEKIVLGEKATVADQQLNYDGAAEDLSIVFDKFKVILSKDTNFTSLATTLELTDTSKVTVNYTTDRFSLVPTNLYGETLNTENKSYIDLVFDNQIELTELQTLFDKDEASELGKIYDVYELKEKTLTFTWGSVFGNTSPSTYYNNLLTQASSVEEKLLLMEQANRTINHMSEALKGNSLKFTFNIQTA